TDQICAETHGPVGIVSTPVIDRASDTLYVVARNEDYSIWLHALDIATGHPKPGTPGMVRIPYDAHNKLLIPSFHANLELSRAGLLLLNGALYIGFSALDCDNHNTNDHWSGWILGYRIPDLQLVASFETISSADGKGAGVWHSGNGLVA